MFICRPFGVFSHSDLICYSWRLLRNQSITTFFLGRGWGLSLGVTEWYPVWSREFTGQVDDREPQYQSKQQQDKTSPSLPLQAKSNGLTPCIDTLDGWKQPNNQSKITKTSFWFKIYIISYQFIIILSYTSTTYQCN